MLNSVLLVFLALFLACIIIRTIIFVYTVAHMCRIWYIITHHPDSHLPAKSVSNSGLSPSQLQKLPFITGKDLLTGSECTICLDDIATDQPARLIPGCNHAFHVECADTWLSKHPMCPLCRVKLDPTLFSSSENPC